MILGLRVPMVLPVRLGRKAIKDRQALRGQQGRLDRKVIKGRKAIKDRRENKARKVIPDLPAPKAQRDQKATASARITTARVR